MLPSEILRDIISKRIGIDLNQYAWNEEFKNFVFKIKLDKMYEETIFNMSEVYKQGFNIGHCGLTSRYLVQNLKNSDLYYGKFSGLVGTKRSEKGGHAWVVQDELVIDTTLMIMLPIDKAKEIGYTFERKLSRSSATVLSEYELYSHEHRHFVNNPSEYFTNLYTITQR